MIIETIYISKQPKQAEKVPTPHKSDIYILTLVTHFMKSLYFFQEKDLQEQYLKLTLQISSPWNPPATSKLSFTARVLT